ncbi:MAG: hypothetical protein U0821_18485 [Chloroflexota bacterium]
MGIARPPLDYDMIRAALAGIAGALAYLAAQEVDRRIANPRSDDLALLAGWLSPRPRVYRPIGLAAHLMAGATFGLGFHRVVAPRLPGPLWLRGMLAAQAENALLWPLVWGVDRWHPAVMRGTLAPLNRGVYFRQSVWRHAALGLVLGLLCPRDPTQPAPAQ